MSVAIKRVGLVLGCLGLSLLSLKAEETVVRVASYNLRNYLVTNRMVEGRYELDYPKPEEEKAALRAVVAHADADVLAIQEIGGQPFLKELQEDLAAYGLAYPYGAIGQGEDAVRHLAVLSKIPFAQVKPHRELEFNYLEQPVRVKRGLLEVTFGTGNATWSLYVVHLKSRHTNHDADFQSQKRRVREAETIRSLLLKQYDDDLQSHPFLVVGDFNDTPDSSTLRRFLRKSGQPLLQAIATVDSRGENWTYHYAKAATYQRVDYILASLPMVERCVADSATIVDILPVSRKASDHRLIYADFAF